MNVSTKTEKYTPEKVEKVKAIIARYGKIYCIFLDDMRVVERTRDISQFESFEEFVDEDTKELKIQVFQGTSNRADLYHFCFGEVPPPAEETPKTQLPGVTTLSGTQEAVVNELVDNAIFKRDHEKLQKDLKEAEEYIEKLQEEVDRLKENAKPGMISELGSTLLSLVKENPQALGRLNILGGLGGHTETAQRETEASFTKKEPPLSEVDRQYLRLLRNLQAVFSPDQLQMIMEILQNLGKDPEQIETILSLLINQKNQQL